VVAVLAGGWTALAAWVSFGTIGFSGPPPSARVGVVPVDPLHIAGVAIAGVAMLAAAWRVEPSRRVLFALAPLLFVLDRKSVV